MIRSSKVWTQSISQTTWRLQQVNLQLPCQWPRLIKTFEISTPKAQSGCHSWAIRYQRDQCHLHPYSLASPHDNLLHLASMECDGRDRCTATAWSGCWCACLLTTLHDNTDQHQPQPSQWLLAGSQQTKQSFVTENDVGGKWPETSKLHAFFQMARSETYKSIQWSNTEGLLQLLR